MDAFILLEKYLKSLNKDKVVIFLDEVPWIDTHGGNFLSALSYFWNNWNDDSKLLKLFVCGLSTT